MSQPLGSTVGNYRIEALLGTGGIGQVFRATHLDLERPAAVKILHMQYAGDPSFQARFKREARAAGALHHPNIVEIIDSGQDNGRYYLVMELAPDGSLRELMRERTALGTPLPLPFGIDLICQAARGLGYAHERGMVHRDVKPDNLLIIRTPQESGEEPAVTVKLSDFGLVRLGEEGLATAQGVTMGTPAYMSPEQCQGVELDGRTDIYSLGVVLYEVTTGYLPFHTSSLTDAVFKHVYTEPPSPLTVKADLPVALEGIILRCLRKAPPERFQSAWELIDALKPFLEKRAPAVVAPPPELDAATVLIPPAPVPAVTPPVVAAAVPAPAPVDGPFEPKAAAGDWADTLRRVAVPLLIAAAGLLMMLGSVGPWIEWGEDDVVEGRNISEYFSGEQVYDELPSDGSATLLFGAIVALIGVAKAFVSGRSARVVLSIVALIALVLAALIAVYSWGYLADSDYPRGWGLELVLVAAVVGALFSVLDMRKRTERRA